MSSATPPSHATSTAWPWIASRRLSTARIGSSSSTTRILAMSATPSVLLLLPRVKDLAEFGPQVLGREGLHQEARAGARDRLPRSRVVGVARDEQRRGGRMLLADAADDVAAPHARHDDVADDAVHGAAEGFEQPKG